MLCILQTWLSKTSRDLCVATFEASFMSHPTFLLRVSVVALGRRTEMGKVALSLNKLHEGFPVTTINLPSNTISQKAISDERQGWICCKIWKTINTETKSKFIHVWIPPWRPKWTDCSSSASRGKAMSSEISIQTGSSDLTEIQQEVQAEVRCWVITTIHLISILMNGQWRQWIKQECLIILYCSK